MAHKPSHKPNATSGLDVSQTQPLGRRSVSQTSYEEWGEWSRRVSDSTCPSMNMKHSVGGGCAKQARGVGRVVWTCLRLNLSIGAYEALGRRSVSRCAKQTMRSEASGLDVSQTQPVHP